MNLKNVDGRRPEPRTPAAAGFTLIELLIVIAIIGVLAAFTVTVLGSITRTKSINTARSELSQIQAALENYKAKYGVYPPGNQNPDSTYISPATPQLRACMLNQLYYELSGVVNNGTDFVVLNGTESVPANNPGRDAKAAFGAAGFLNSSRGSGEDAVPAKNFLLNLKSQMISAPFTNDGTRVLMLVTSVGGPDASYKPLQVTGQNPFRYLNPGVQNPGGYDLWVQLVISGKTNLVCNWSKSAQVNTPFP